MASLHDLEEQARGLTLEKYLVLGSLLTTIKRERLYMQKDYGG